jgi:hypothetical protein
MVQALGDVSELFTRLILTAATAPEALIETDDAVSRSGAGVGDDGDAMVIKPVFDTTPVFDTYCPICPIEAVIVVIGETDAGVPPDIPPSAATILTPTEATAPVALMAADAPGSILPMEVIDPLFVTVALLDTPAE